MLLRFGPDIEGAVTNLVMSTQIGRSLLSPTDSYRNPEESGPFQSFLGNGFLAKVSATVGLLFWENARPEFELYWNSGGLTGLESQSGMGRNGICCVL